MDYVVQVVDDGELAERDIVIVERGPDLPAVMLLSGRPAEIWRAMRAWEDTREECTIPTQLYAVS